LLSLTARQFNEKFLRGFSDLSLRGEIPHWSKDRANTRWTKMIYGIISRIAGEHNLTFQRELCWDITLWDNEFLKVAIESEVSDTDWLHILKNNGKSDGGAEVPKLITADSHLKVLIWVFSHRNYFSKWNLLVRDFSSAVATQHKQRGQGYLFIGITLPPKQSNYLYNAAQISEDEGSHDLSLILVPRALR